MNNCDKQKMGNKKKKKQKLLGNHEETLLHQEYIDMDYEVIPPRREFRRIVPIVHAINYFQLFLYVSYESAVYRHRARAL